MLNHLMLIFVNSLYQISQHYDLMLSENVIFTFLHSLDNAHLILKSPTNIPIWTE